MTTTPTATKVLCPECRHENEPVTSLQTLAEDEFAGGGLHRLADDDALDRPVLEGRLRHACSLEGWDQAFLDKLIDLLL